MLKGKKGKHAHMHYEIYDQQAHHHRMVMNHLKLYIFIPFREWRYSFMHSQLWN